MVGSGSSNPLESNLKFNGARSLSPLSLLGGGIQQGLPYWMSEGSFSDSGQTTLLAWLAPAACVGTSRLQGIPHKPSQHSTFLDRTSASQDRGWLCYVLSPDLQLEAFLPFAGALISFIIVY